VSKVCESKTDADQQVVDLVGDLARRMHQRESVDLKKSVAEHAEHAEPLRGLFRALGLLAQMSVVERATFALAAGPTVRVADWSIPAEGVLGETDHRGRDDPLPPDRIGPEIDHAAERTRLECLPGKEEGHRSGWWRRPTIHRIGI
jgi:hypothetical protein